MLITKGFGIPKPFFLLMFIPSIDKYLYVFYNYKLVCNANFKAGDL